MSPPRAVLPFALWFLVALFCLGVYLYGIQPETPPDPVFRSPRQNVAWVLAGQFAKGHGFRYRLSHYEQLPKEIARALTPRDAAIRGRDVVPKDFAGTILLYAGVTAIWPRLTAVISPLSMVVSALLVAKLASLLLDRDMAFPAFVQWLAFPAAILNASANFSGDTLSVALLLGALVLFVRYWDSGRLLDLFACCLLFSAASAVRYPNVLAVIPTFAALAWSGRLKRRAGIVAVLGLMPAVALVMVFNAGVYGDPLTTGYQLGDRLAASTVNPPGGTLFPLSWSIAAQNVRTYAAGWPLLALTNVAGLCIGAYLTLRLKERRLLIGSVMATSLILFLYSLMRVVWGTFDLSLDSSVLRYLLPSTAMSGIFLVYGVRRLAGSSSRVGTAAVLFLAASYLISAYRMPGGLADSRDLAGRLDAIKQAVADNTPHQALVITRIADKTIFPSRQTITLAYLSQNRAVRTQRSIDFWRYAPGPRRFSLVSRTVVSRGIPLYLLADIDGKLLNSYEKALADEGLKTERVDTGLEARGLPALFGIVSSAS